MKELTKDQKESFWAKLRKNGDCLEWTGAAREGGYGHMRIGSRTTGNSRVVLSHRVAYFIANSAISDDLFICHNCDNPSCCNPEHLFAGTPKDNVRDMDQKGRRVIAPCKGSKNGRALLSEELVLELRSAEGSYRALAAKYGISKSQVARVKTGQQWICA